MDTNLGSSKLDAKCAPCSLPRYSDLADGQTHLQSYYVKSTHTLLMTSSASRSQACNVDDVLAKVGFGLACSSRFTLVNIYPISYMP